MKGQLRRRILVRGSLIGDLAGHKKGLRVVARVEFAIAATINTIKKFGQFKNTKNKLTLLFVN